MPECRVKCVEYCVVYRSVLMTDMKQRGDGYIRGVFVEKADVQKSECWVVVFMDNCVLNGTVVVVCEPARTSWHTPEVLE